MDSPPDPAPGAARLRVAGFAGALLYAVFVFGFFRVLGSNELTTLPIARSVFDPTVYPRDWFYGEPPRPRLPFAVLLSPLTWIWPLPIVAVVARVLTWALLFGGLGRVFSRVGLRPGWWVPVLAIFFGLGQSLFAGEWIIKWVESKVLAYAAVFFGLSFVLDRSWGRAGLALGAASSAHALVGGWSTLAAMATTLVLRRRLEPRWGRALLGLGVGASLGIYLAAQVVLEPSPELAARDPVWIYVYFRNPHHLDPFAFDWNLVRIAGTVVVTGYAVFRFVRGPSLAARVVAGFVVFSMLAAAIGMIAAFLPEGARLLRFYPFRVGPSAGLLLTLALIAVDLDGAVRARRSGRLRWARSLPWVATAGLLLTATPTFARQLGLFIELPSGAMIGDLSEARPFDDVTRWLREHTPPDAVLLASPRYIEAGVLSERSMPVSFKGVPAGKAGLLEWYRRIVRMSGGVEPKSRGFEAPREVDERFNALSREAYLDLAEEFEADVLLIERRDDLGLPELYANARWGVYALTSTRSEVTRRE